MAEHDQAVPETVAAAQSTINEVSRGKKMSARNGVNSAIVREAAVAGGKSPSEGLRQAHQDIIAWMYKPRGATVDQGFQFLEQQLGMQREYISYVLLGIWALYMMVGGGAQFLSNLIGFVYPCYASVRAIRTEGKDDDTQWLVYWTTFSSFFLVDAFAGVFLSWFPFYFILKTAFLVYLWLPQTNGALYIYKVYVDPAFSYIERELISKYMQTVGQ